VRCSAISADPPAESPARGHRNPGEKLAGRAGRPENRGVSVSLLPAAASPRHALTRRSWVVGYAVETLEMAAQEERTFARDSAWDAKRLEPPRRSAGRERALFVPPQLDVRASAGPEGWHQAGMPLPTSAFLAMRDATRHLR